jgi:hypothetical protein
VTIPDPAQKIKKAVENKRIHFLNFMIFSPFFVVLNSASSALPNRVAPFPGPPGPIVRLNRIPHAEERGSQDALSLAHPERVPREIDGNPLILLPLC